MGNELYIRMKQFYETSPMAQQMASVLREGAVAEVRFEGDEGIYQMIKKGGRGLLLDGRPARPEVVMTYNRGAVDYMIDSPADNLQEYAIRFSRCVLEPRADRKIGLKLTTNIVTATKMGYFRMMQLGGRPALEMVLKLGIKIPKRFLLGEKGRRTGKNKPGGDVDSTTGVPSAGTSS